MYALGFVLFASALILASCGSSSGSQGPPGPPGPTGPPATAATPTPLPVLLAFSPYVGALTTSASTITVVNVTNPKAPVTYDQLTMPDCRDQEGNSLGRPVNNDSSHGAMDDRDDVVAVQMCFSTPEPAAPNGINSGSVLVFPYIGGGYGFPLTLFSNVTETSPTPGPLEGIAVNGTTLDYGSVDTNGNASMNVGTYLPTTSLTAVTSIAVPVLTTFGTIAIGPKATFFSDFDSPILFQMAPNGIGGIASQLPGPFAYGMTFDPTGRLWVAQGSSIGIRDGYTGAPISTMSTGTLTNVFGIQFDRAGNLWITNPSDDGTTTTVNGYIAPVATASALPSPSSSFTLANSVNFVQGSHRRPAANAMHR